MESKKKYGVIHVQIAGTATGLQMVQVLSDDRASVVITLVGKEVKIEDYR